MTRSYRLAPLLLAALLAACGGSGPKSAGTQAPPVDAGQSARESAGRAIELLTAGKPEEARKLLAKLLKRQPNDALATGLLNQIDRDPVALLGEPNYAYTVRAGETLSEIAGRFLGNPTSFYALGRYNGLTFPVTLAAGQTLRIPGEPKIARPRPAPAKPAAAPTRKAEAKPVVPPPAKPAVDPARATRLRAAALEQLNRGAVDRAVGLLRQADAAAPGNPLVRRDLDRALRIQRTVRR